MIIKGYDIEIPETRAALVLELQEDIRCDKKHFRDSFKQMLDDMEVAWNGANAVRAGATESSARKRPPGLSTRRISRKARGMLSTGT